MNSKVRNFNSSRLLIAHKNLNELNFENNGDQLTDNSGQLILMLANIIIYQLFSTKANASLSNWYYIIRYPYSAIQHTLIISRLCQAIITIIYLNLQYIIHFLLYDLIFRANFIKIIQSIWSLQNLNLFINGEISFLKIILDLLHAKDIVELRKKELHTAHGNYLNEILIATLNLIILKISKPLFLQSISSIDFITINLHLIFDVSYNDNPLCILLLFIRCFYMLYDYYQSQEHHRSIDHHVVVDQDDDQLAIHILDLLTQLLKHKSHILMKFLMFNDKIDHNSNIYDYMTILSKESISAYIQENMSLTVLQFDLLNDGFELLMTGKRNDFITWLQTLDSSSLVVNIFKHYNEEWLHFNTLLQREDKISHAINKRHTSYIINHLDQYNQLYQDTIYQLDNQNIYKIIDMKDLYQESRI